MCIEEAVFLAPLSPTFPHLSNLPFSSLLQKQSEKFPQNRLPTSPIHHPIKNIQN